MYLAFINFINIIVFVTGAGYHPESTVKVLTTLCENACLQVSAAINRVYLHCICMKSYVAL